jgi:hypothetical protein
MALTAVLIMQEGVQSDVLLSMEGVRQMALTADHAGGSPFGRAGVNGGSPAKRQ